MVQNAFKVRSMEISSCHQLKMEQFYDALASVIREKNYCVWLDSYLEEGFPNPEWLLFEESVCGEPYDTELEEFLGYVVEKDYRIVMNFYAPDVVLGNVAVKINGRWFAFGECRNENPEEQFVTEIWPLKYVLPKMRQMEVKLRYAVSIRPSRHIG